MHYLLIYIEFLQALQERPTVDFRWKNANNSKTLPDNVKHSNLIFPPAKTIVTDDQLGKEQDAERAEEERRQKKNLNASTPTIKPRKVMT